MKVKSVNVTKWYASKGSKETEFQIDGICIARSSSFRCNGRFNAGRTGRTFYWYYDNLIQIFGQKFIESRHLFDAWKNPDLVYSCGGTLSFKRVKEIIAELTV
jgi:hypothetical protein